MPDPVETLQRAEVREILRAALSELTPREREAFVLRDLEGLSTSEVAGALSVTPGSVRSLLTLARRRLRHVLGQRLGVPLEEGGSAS